MINKESYDATIDIRQSVAKQKIIEALKEMPIVEVVCRKTAVSRATYYRWRQEDKVFRRESDDALGQGIEFVSDMSESQLVSLIKDKKMPAIAMWLKNNHPRYGSKGRPYSPITPVDELTDEEQTLIIEALAMASGENIKKQEDEKNNS